MADNNDRLEEKVFKLVYPHVPFMDKHSFAMGYCLTDESIIKHVMSKNELTIMVNPETKAISLWKSGMILDSKV